MNTSHYPSLELCKKLTEIGFPITEKFWQYGKICDAFHDCMIHSEASVCPSVMEMLDVIPQYIDDGELVSYGGSNKIVKCFPIRISPTDEGWRIEYKWQVIRGDNVIIDDNCKILFRGSLPNALAEMVLWLHENNYISFNK